MHGLSQDEEIDYWRERARRAEGERKQDGEIIAKVNDAINRAGVHCAIYFWEAIDQIAADRDSLRQQLAAAQQEIEGMRAVYEAAVEWSESFGELSKRLPPHVHKLRAAVDAATKDIP